MNRIALVPYWAYTAVNLSGSSTKHTLNAKLLKEILSTNDLNDYMVINEFAVELLRDFIVKANTRINSDSLAFSKEPLNLSLFLVGGLSRSNFVWEKPINMATEMAVLKHKHNYDKSMDSMLTGRVLPEGTTFGLKYEEVTCPFSGDVVDVFRVVINNDEDHEKFNFNELIKDLFKALTNRGHTVQEITKSGLMKVCLNNLD